VIGYILQFGVDCVQQSLHTSALIQCFATRCTLLSTATHTSIRVYSVTTGTTTAHTSIIYTIIDSHKLSRCIVVHESTIRQQTVCVIVLVPVRQLHSDESMRVHTCLLQPLNFSHCSCLKGDLFSSAPLCCLLCYSLCY
jgi:hypothetical protein